MADALTDPKEIEATLTEFSKKLDRLRTLYEQYFMGIEKREPLVPLKDVVRVMRRLDNAQIRNTGQRFRFRSLVQKFNSYRNYWNRTVRAIEQGTYHRDVARLRRKMARKGIDIPSSGRVLTVGELERAMTQATQQDTSGAQANKRPSSEVRGVSADELRQRVHQPEPGLGGSLNDDEEDTDRTARPSPEPSASAQSTASSPTSPPPPAEQQPRPRPAAARDQAGAGLSEDQMQSIYRRFVRAKEMCGEDTSQVRYDVLARSIGNQLPQIREKYQGRDVDFQVVIRSGRAVLKARPK
jgi:hypothetical protein